MPRAYWKGSLKLSLVTCPIALYPATTYAEKTHFHQINVRTGHRLKQQMVDAQTGDVVEGEDKGRGYEVSKGRYVEIDEDELDALRLESTHTIEIDAFVPVDDIDQRYLDKPYYIAPLGKAGADAFVVIRDAMKREARAALGRVVLSNREHVIALRPLGKGLIGTTLRYPYELREAAPYFRDIPSPKISRDMVDLAAHILDSKAASFDPGRFKDKYETALRALVKRKAAGHTIKAPEPVEEESNVIDLMEALRRSAGKGAAKAGGKRASRAKQSGAGARPASRRQPRRRSGARGRRKSAA